MESSSCASKECKKDQPMANFVDTNERVVMTNSRRIIKGKKADLLVTDDLEDDEDFIPSKGTKVLMLQFKGDAVPFAYQVPVKKYERFKYLENITLTDRSIPDYIENFKM